MPVKVIDGDLFDTKAKYICHQVNCRGRMGSGVAKQIREKYPSVYDAYAEMYCDSIKNRNTNMILGLAQFVKCDDGVTIVNMFAQRDYGYDKKRYTDYSAFRSCLEIIRDAVPESEVIAMPYKIGCGLGGGSWDVILDLIERKLPNHTVELWRKEVQ